MMRWLPSLAMFSKNYLPKMKLNLKIPAIDGVFPGIGLDFIWGKTVMKQVSAGMTVPEGSARELPLGEDWVEPIALFFQCKGVLWQDMARDGNHLHIVISQTDSLTNSQLAKG